MEAKGPVLLHDRKANDLLIGRGNLGLRVAGKEVQINATTKSAPRDTVFLEQDLVTVSISKVDAVRSRGVGRAGVCGVTASHSLLRAVHSTLKVASLQIEWMGTVNVAKHRLATEAIQS